MSLTMQDQVVGALTAWREDRDGGQPGMQAVVNVLANRAAARGTSIYAECVRPAQFTSITVRSDPELAAWPSQAHSTPEDWAMWLTAQSLLAQEAAGVLEDITNGATLYYEPASLPAGETQPYALPNGTATVAPASWNMAVVRYLCTVGGQLYFKQL